MIEPAEPVGSRRREWKYARGALPTSNGAGTHTGWTINGLGFDPSRVDALARLGDLEVWRISSSLDHSVHVHLDQFQVLDRRGGPPRPEDAGWKDTVALRSGDEVTVAVRFTDYAGRYVFHCHNLEHEDMAMMAVLRTV